jgi:peptide/nickel transport system substrate-binding protein
MKKEHSIMKKISLVSLAAALILTLILGACSQNQTPPAATTAQEASVSTQPAAAENAGPKNVSVAIVSAWDSMMPLNTNSNYGQLIYDQIYDRLAQANGDGTFSPRLAKSWKVNENSTAITFQLNDNVKWHDGQPLTAADVVFSFQLYSDPQVEALSRYTLQYIAGTDDAGAETSKGSIGVVANGDYEVTINLKSPIFADTLLTSINGVYIIPKHIFEGKTAAEINAPDLWAKPVGSGPFIYESEISGERMELVKNADYFQGAPDIDRLTIRVVDSTNLLAGLINGEIDIVGLGNIPLDDWDLAKQQENITTLSIPSTSYQTLILNTQKPYLTEKVRQALSMAINRNVLVSSLLKNEGVPIITPIAPVSPYYNKDVSVWYDPEKAKQILKEEKFPFDRTMTFFVPTGNVTRERAAALIVQDFENIGVKTQIKQVDFPTLMNNMREGLHDFGIIGSGGTLDPSESRQMISPDSSVNFGRLTSTELQDIIDQEPRRLPLIPASRSLTNTRRG